MLGALLCGLVYAKFPRLPAACLAEVFGTAVLGGLCAYPVAILVVGKDPAAIAFYAYIVPFLISTAAGAILAGIALGVLDRAGVLRSWQLHRPQEG